MVEASEGFHRVKYKYSPMGDILQREGEDGSVLLTGPATITARITVA